MGLRLELLISEYKAPMPAYLACSFLLPTSQCSTGAARQRDRQAPPAEGRKDGKQSLEGSEPPSKTKPPLPAFGLTMPFFVASKESNAERRKARGTGGNNSAFKFWFDHFARMSL